MVYVQEQKLYPTLEEFTSNECLNKLGSPLAKWSEKKVPGSEMKPQTNFSQMRSSHQTNSLVTPRCKLSPAPGRRRISPGHLFNHPGSLSDIRIRSIFQHQNVVKGVRPSSRPGFFPNSRTATRENCGNRDPLYLVHLFAVLPLV